MTLRRLAVRFLVSIALSLSGCVTLTRPASAATPPESDIPGTALPGPVVTGQLGGSIYDVVYRLEVPAGYVLLAGLTGSPGTDFDLYLYDSSATTVLGTFGLLRKSIGDASTEAISWPSRVSGTLYLDLNGASDVMGTYTLSVQVVPDSTPPSATLVVAGGHPRVNTQQVAVRLAGFDDLSGLVEMSLSYDGVNYLQPVPLLTQFEWTLASGDGPKTLWARVINGVGLPSPPVSASVFLDTASPAVVSTTPADGATVSVPRPVISVRFTEPIAESTWRNLGLIAQAAVGGVVAGTYAYSQGMQTGTFTPSSDLDPGYLYSLTIGDVRDLAGNRANPVSWTLTYLQSPSLTASVTPGVMVAGSSATLSGTVTLPPGDSLQLEAREGGATAYVPVGSIAPTSGRYLLPLTPAMNTSYRISYSGSPTTAAASVEVRALVRRGVSILGSASSVVRTAKAGRPVTLTAQVTPAGVTSISFRLYRYDSSRRSYRYAGSFGRSTSSEGRASLGWTPSAGRWYWRIAVPSTVEFANNQSAVYRYAVGR